MCLPLAIHSFSPAFTSVFTSTYVIYKKCSPVPQSMGECQPYVKSEETSFSMEEKVVFLVPQSNSYPCELYGKRIGEPKGMQKKTQYGGDQTLSIPIFKVE